MTLKSDKTALLGRRCAATLLRRLAPEAGGASRRHIIDFLPHEVRRSTFEALLDCSDTRADCYIADESGGRRLVGLAAVRVGEAELIPFLVEDVRNASGSVESSTPNWFNRGSEGFASYLRDYFTDGSGRQRFLVTFTEQGNETQESTRDLEADRALLSIALVLETVLLEHPTSVPKGLDRVLQIYASLQGPRTPWEEILSRWESFVTETDGGSVEEIGAALPMLGCFLADRTPDFLDAPRVRLLPDAEDKKRRRLGDPNADTRLNDNAIIRAYLQEVFEDPNHDADEAIRELFGDEGAGHAKTIVEGGSEGLDHLEFQLFNDLARISRGRSKNEFNWEHFEVEGARYFKLLEQAGDRFVVVTADRTFTMVVGLKFPFRPRKEHAQKATWNAETGKLEPTRIAVEDQAEFVRFQVTPGASPFTVWRLALSPGPRTIQKPIDQFFLAVYQDASAEIVVEEERRIDVELQAWVARDRGRFVRYAEGVEAEPIADLGSGSDVFSIDEGDDADEATLRRQIRMVGSSLRPAIAPEPPPADSEEATDFHLERLLETAAHTSKVGEQTLKVFQSADPYVDTIVLVDDTPALLWRIDFKTGKSREFLPSRHGLPEPLLYERAVTKLLSAPASLLWQWSRKTGFTAVATEHSRADVLVSFLQARERVFLSIGQLAKRLIPRCQRGHKDAGVPLWLLPLLPLKPEVDGYLQAWCDAVDASMGTGTTFSPVHARLLQLDQLHVLDDEGRRNRLVVLPTHPWLLAALVRYQEMMSACFRSTGKKPALRRHEVEQLVPRSPLEDWYTENSDRYRLTDGAPFHLEYVPEVKGSGRNPLEYVSRVVSNKIERYLRMHPHLRTERRSLRIGFVDPGDGAQLLGGIREWLGRLIKDRDDRLRILPRESIPSIEVFLFARKGEAATTGTEFDAFFARNVRAAEQDTVEEALAGNLRYRKCDTPDGPSSPADAVHICFVHGLVDPTKQERRTCQLLEWWDGGFGDGLLATYLRHTQDGPSTGQLISRRGLSIDPDSTGLRGALGRLLTLQRGSKDYDLDPNKAFFWDSSLPTLHSMEPLYRNSDWVVHLDRELSLELFSDKSTSRRKTIIEYSDQEVPETPGYDTITVTQYAEPYKEQLSEVLTTVALDVRGRGDPAELAAHAILDDINALSGSWAIDFLLGSIAAKRYSLRLKGNVGAALVYRWLKRVERSAESSNLIQSNVGPVVPVFISLEELLRVTPAANLPTRDGLVARYTNEDDSDDATSSWCDDLLVLYLTRTERGKPSRLYGRIIEVKFGTTALSARDKAVRQIRNTQEFLQKHLCGSNDAVAAPFRHKQLSLLIKAQLEQAVAMKLLSPEVYKPEVLDVQTLSANLATGNYEVDYYIGHEGKNLLGDAFLLDTRHPGDIPNSDAGPECHVSVSEGVRVVNLGRKAVEWLAFDLSQTPTLTEPLPVTLPRLGRYRDLKTQTGTSRRIGSDLVAAPSPVAPPVREEAKKRGEELQLRLEVPGLSDGTLAPLEVVPLAAAGGETTDIISDRLSAQDQLQSVSLADASQQAVKEAPYPEAAVVEVVERLEASLRGHKVQIAGGLSPRETDRGPRLLRVYVRLETGESIQSIRRISEDLAREVGTETSDLHISNVPERNSVGIDLPVRGLRYGVGYSDLLGHPSFAAAQDELTLGFCAGIDVTGRPVWADLAQMPHMLVAGTTGSGKTVFLRNVLLTLLLHNPADRLLLRLSSSKPMDFRSFTRVPHAAGQPMATDGSEAMKLAQELAEEMNRRIAIISEADCDNLAEFNRQEPPRALPYIVAVFDEYAEMINGFDDRDKKAAFETAIARLAQKARAAGIHLIICMQRPDATALKGAIKANVLHRFALKLPQLHDSQIILDQPGAETLLGQGDLLYKDASSRLYRLQVPDLESSYMKGLIAGVTDGREAPGLDVTALRTCPRCGKSGSIQELFGTRRTKHARRDGSEVITERAQSYCKSCRSGGLSS